MATRDCLDAAQRARFEADGAQQIIERSRLGAVVGVFFCLARAWLLPSLAPSS